MMKKIVFFILWCAATNTLYAQKVQEQNLYTINPFLLNPAYCGANDGLFAMVGFRSAYTGLNQSPRNLFLSAHAPLSQKAGLGTNLFSDTRGVLNTLSANISSSYLVKLSGEHQVRLGLSGGFFKQSIQDSKVKNADMSDPTLSSANHNFSNYNFGFGAAYQFKDLQFGFALPDLVSETKSLRSYANVYARYDFKLQNTIWKISPVLLYQQLPVSPDQFDAQVLVTWKELLWAQVGYRINNAGIFSGGINLGDVAVAYAYQANTGVRSVISRGGHEVALVLNLKGKKNKEKNQGGLFKDESFAGDDFNNPDTSNYVLRLEMMDKELESQKRKLDSLSKLDNEERVKAQKQQDAIAKDMADLQRLKNELAIYLKNVNEVLDSNQVDISSNEEFDLKFYDYFVAVGTYKNFNYVKFFKKQLKSRYDIDTDIIQSADRKVYILSSRKVVDKEEALSEIQFLNGNINEQYYDGNARVVRKRK